MSRLQYVLALVTCVVVSDYGAILKPSLFIESSQVLAAPGSSQLAQLTEPLDESLEEAGAEGDAETAQDQALEEALLQLQRSKELHQQGKYEEALLLAQGSLERVESVLGSDHPAVASCLNELAVNYQALGDYAVAQSLLERALAIEEAVLEPDYAVISTIVSNLASLHQDQGDYDAALLLFERALSMREAALGSEHELVGQSLNNLADAYYGRGDYATALSLFERSLSIKRAALGDNHPSVATTLNNLGFLHRAQGDYTTALSLFEEALAILEAALGREHPTIASILSNLGALQRDYGNYTEALLLLERALAVAEKTLGAEHPTVAYGLNELALLYQAQNNTGAALPLLERALSIQEATLGESHPRVATALDNLAGVYVDQQDYVRAQSFYERALSIREAAYGESHPSIATNLNNLAELYTTQANYAAALPLYERSLAIKEAIFGSEHVSVGTSLNNLAVLHRDQGNYETALRFFERSLAVFELTLGNEHPSFATVLSNLADMRVWQGQPESAIELFRQANAITEDYLSDALASTSEKKRQQYIDRLDWNTDKFISLSLDEASSIPEAKTLALSTIFQRKGRVLDATADTSLQLRKQLSSENQLELDRLNAIRTQLTGLRFSDLAVRSPQQYQTQLAALETEADAIEEKLARRSVAFRVESEPITVDSVRALIPEDAALVELVKFSPYSFERSSRDWEAPRYAAYVLTAEGGVELLDLGDAAAIDRLVAVFSRSLAARSDGVDVIARQLDEQMMAPVRQLVGDKTHLLISPDSQLTLVPFEALVDEQGQYLTQRYQVSYLTSGRDLLKQQLSSASQQSSVIIADPDYMVAAASAQSSDGSRRSVDASRLSFGPLPGTADEARAIASLLPKVTLLTGQQASESNLKQVISPHILHIATHGFFLPDVEFVASVSGERTASLEVIATEELDQGAQISSQVTQSNLENPLLRSGLALAGANTRSGDGEDGIFTALEASGLDLYGTQLVVLSACETGLGTTSTGEGVYGLRRAFTIAGAQSQLMSLWQVDDLGTSELMTMYYQNLIEKGQGRSEALRNAQLALIEQGGAYAHPYYWSSFILSGDWRPVGRTD